MEQGFIEKNLEADRNARRRDVENRIDIDSVGRELDKVRERGLRLIPLEYKNKAQFYQVIAPNIRYLISEKYLTTAELAFLTSISGNVEMHSNAIVSFDEGREGQYLKVSDIAKTMHYSERQASRLINALIGKGIIYEFADNETIKQYGRVLEERPLFLNPEIIFSGDRNKISATLCRLVMNADHLEKKKKRLPWKLWLESGHENGRLYLRDTWMRKKRDENKNNKKAIKRD